MKKILLAAVTVTFLAACGSKGGGDSALLVDKCVEDGEADKETCVCMVGAMEDNLDKKTFGKLVQAAKDGNDTDAVMEELMGDMSDPEAMEKMMKLGMAVMKCDPSIMEGMQ
ncbi:MAG: hypothetical protein HKN36_05735 [Hellea sp.]|nr:hypothetical protein [Hellea sp.]